MSNHGFGFSSNNDDNNDRNDDNQNNNNQNGDSGQSNSSSGNRGQGDNNRSDSANDGGNSPGGSGNPFEAFFNMGGGSGGDIPGFSAFPGGFAVSGSSGQGSLGDILSQFGTMLSGMGSSMNSPDAKGPINFAMADKIARQTIKQSNPTPVRQSDYKAVEDSTSLVELWLSNATILPSNGKVPEVWDPSEWLSRTLPTWKRFISPVAESLNEAQKDVLPEEAKQMAGSLLGMLAQIGGINMGMQLGRILGDIATSVTSVSEWGFSLDEKQGSALLTGQLDTLAEEFNKPKREVLIYLCARELAHQRLFAYVPWLEERLLLAVETYSRGLSLDTSAMEEASRSIDPEALSDPSRMQDMFQQIQNMDLSPQIVASNEHAGIQLDTMLSLVEGWVDNVLADALFERIPVMESIQKSWSARRAMKPGLENMAGNTGLDFSASHADEAAELWRRLTVAVGIDRRDHVWDHPDFLPTADDIAHPAEFIDGILGESDNDEFNPISEIEKLERELNGQSGNSRGGDSTQEGGSGREDDSSAGSSDEADGSGNGKNNADGSEDDK
ncbi:zinc-dependent metalloprotease [uncultured Corynebacterium sp.]|uniref:zinc-dependent metalloprotease n=1 Tax=uncultured Corynebacterium sp. TaxID=159447 RepID=UPI0025D7CD70|nr:zinc-dependent metalloprotease [uncultured Corynebacterium sp.]